MPLAAPYPGAYVEDDTSLVLQYWYFDNIPTWKKMPEGSVSNIQDIDPFYTTDLSRIIRSDLYIKGGNILLEYYIVFHLSGTSDGSMGNRFSFDIKVPDKNNIPVSVVTNYAPTYTDADNTTFMHTSSAFTNMTNANFSGTGYLDLPPKETLLVGYGVLFRDE